jgi:hypothetical protein
MLLRFFRSIGSQMIIFIPFLGLLLWLHSLIHIPQAVFLFDKVPMPLYKFISDLLPPSSIFASILTLTLVVIQGFWLVRLNSRFMIINNRTYLPALLFVIITASFPGLQRLNPAIFSGFFLLLAIEKMFESYHNNKPAHEYFIAAFYISLGAVFYPYLIFFMFIVWTGLVVLRPFHWREWVYSFFGFATPFFFLFCFYYLVHNDPYRVYNDFKTVFQIRYSFAGYSPMIIIFLVYILFFILMASQFMIKTFVGKKILPRKAYVMFLWLFINSLAVYVLIPQASVELIFIAAIPISYLLAHYLAFMKAEFWGNIFLLLLLILIVLVQVW